MNILNITKGAINAVLGKRQTLRDKRIAICEQCPLCFDSDAGKICSTNWISKDGKTVSTVKQDGYIRGCGCFLNAKTRVPDEECVIGKW